MFTMHSSVCRPQSGHALADTGTTWQACTSTRRRLTSGRSIRRRTASQRIAAADPSCRWGALLQGQLGQPGDLAPGVHHRCGPRSRALALMQAKTATCAARLVAWRSRPLQCPWEPSVETVCRGHNSWSQRPGAHSAIPQRCKKSHNGSRAQMHHNETMAASSTKSDD